MRALGGLVGALLALAPAAADETEPGGGSWVDLSHPLGPGTHYWPTGSRFELEVLARGEDESGLWYAANRFRTPEHLGTHLDAPFHFHPGGWTANAIPLERMSGPAHVIDLREPARAQRDLAVDAARLRGWEQQHGRIAKGAVVLLGTGWDVYWGDSTRYFGSEQAARGDASDLHFPGLAPDGAKLLVERDVVAVGIDTASIDPGQSRSFESHRVLAAANVLIYENLRQLERLPARGAHFMAFALPIESGTGGPVRAVARIAPKAR